MSTVTPFLNLVKPTTVEQYSLSTQNNNLDSIDTWAQNTVSKMAQGYKAYAEMAADSAALTTIAVATFIPSFTFKAGRRYRVGASGGGFFSDTTSTFSVAISTCLVTDTSSSTAGLTQIKARGVRGDVAGEGREIMSIAKENFTVGSDTALQIKLTIGRLNGAGTVTLASSATNRVSLYIEDLGVQF